MKRGRANGRYGKWRRAITSTWNDLLDAANKQADGGVAKQEHIRRNDVSDDENNATSHASIEEMGVELA